MGLYNCRMYDYGDFVQFRFYDNPIRTDEIGCNATPDPALREADPFFLAPEDIKPHQLTMDDFLGYKMLDQEKHKHCLAVSVNRSIQSIYEYSYANMWDWFITFTFAPEKADRFDYDDVVKKTRKWFMNLRNRKAPDLKYLFIPEKHKDGAYHIHGLLADCGSLEFEDSGRVAVGKKAVKRTEKNNNFPTIYNVSGWRFGFSTATRIQDNNRACSYMAKYITKDLCDDLHGKRRFYPSNNLNRVEKTELNLPPDEFDRFILDRMVKNQVEYIKEQKIPEAKQRIRYVTIKKEYL